ncbi:MAG: cyclase/dehydrase [Gammaproteobacteria bacterium]|nr:MAG: cyclase/dehydrase [Gammaproteobacteria bacterium]
MLLLLWLPPLQGAQIESLELEETAGGYRVELVALLERPRELVMRLITDYRLLSRINPYVVESRTLPGARPPAQRVALVSEGCLLFFCRRVRHVQDFTRRGWVLDALMVPAQSDFRSGLLRWTLQAPDPRHTRIRMVAQVEPDFWLPPLIGPAILRHALRRMALGSLEGLERISGAVR